MTEAAFSFYLHDTVLRRQRGKQRREEMTRLVEGNLMYNSGIRVKIKEKLYSLCQRKGKSMSKIF